MRRAFSIAVLVCVSGMGVFAAEQKWRGQIGDSMCGLDSQHSLGPDGKPLSAGDCARDCVKQGGTYVLLSGGKVFKLANADKQGVAALAGATVEIEGTLLGGAITISRIVPSKKP
jgi:hypothetical protein